MSLGSKLPCNYYKGLSAGIAKSSRRKLSKVALLACERQTSLGETFINHGLKTPLDDDHRQGHLNSI